MPTNNVYQNPLNVSIKINSNCLWQPEICSQKMLIEETQFVTKLQRAPVPGHSLKRREKNPVPKLGKKKADNYKKHVNRLSHTAPVTAFKLSQSRHFLQRAL